MPEESPAQRWERYRHALRDERLPAAVVDVEAFESNLECLLALVRRSGKRMRVATKSIRCPGLLRRVAEHAGTALMGALTYSAAETAFLAAGGMRDVLLAYPTVRSADLEGLAAAAKGSARVAMVVDAEEHLRALEHAAVAAGVELGFVVELDVAYRPLPGLHLGVRRSPIRTLDEVVRLAQAGRRAGHLRFDGVMAYEAQIAGVTDSNLAKRWMKVGARPAVATARAKLVDGLRAAGLEPEVVSGGGTGSLVWAAADTALTELTFGSGFLLGELFSHYRDLALSPTAYFALQVVRRPAPHLVTCHGGGFIASGPAGKDRLPTPVLPEGLELLPLEGAGEVQTPVRVPAGLSLALGDPLFFRHAKSGELAEHFNEYLLVRGDQIIDRLPTYRGLGHCFL